MTQIKSAIKRFMEAHQYTQFDPRAALIDMDGVLYDSMPLHASAWYDMVTAHGIKATRDEFFGYEGMTGAATINLLFEREYGRNATADEVAALYKEKTENFHAQGEAPLMKDADKMLGIFTREGMERVLVTGSGQTSLIERISHDYPGAFKPDNFITSRSVAHGKPDPEPYLKAMRLVDVKPWQSIVVENAPCGVRAGARAGAFTVGVATGPIPLDDLMAAGAAIAFDSMGAFVKALPGLIADLRAYNS